jgi:hypothetical protein
MCHFSIPNYVGAGAVEAGAGAASRYGSGYGSGSDQKMRLLAAPAPQHWCEQCPNPFLLKPKVTLDFNVVEPRVN